MKRILAVLLVAALSWAATTSAENIDSMEYEQFCYPVALKNTRRSCECGNDNSPPWGMRAMLIDCSYKDLRQRDISEQLPLYAYTLDLSWNSLHLVPNFASDSLRLLNLMHNNVSRLASNNFAKVSNLRELYLSWNSIQTVEPNAFAGLAHLLVLDLSHNNLHALSSQIFAPMGILETLALSWNRKLNQTVGIEELDFYKSFGVNEKLRTLKLQMCNLKNLILPERVDLISLDMRYNSLTKMPEKLPHALEKFDVSGNLFETMSTNETAGLKTIKELLMEDMPLLTSVEENAFVPLESLRSISFQNSRRLNTFHPHAFGTNDTSSRGPNQRSRQAAPLLESMIFRGTSLRTFNASLAPIFTRLTELDLNGMPLYCDCELVWVDQLTLETNGRCFNPPRLRGMRLSAAKASDFSCNPWPRWVYGMIILGLLILCAGGIWLIVMGLRPNHGVALRRKVGPGSPYSRVTIEPNRQEN